MNDRPTRGEVVLSAEGIVKRFPGVLALDHVDFDVRVREVHGLIGENGAGKSTLMHILAGVTSADEGVISIDGEAIEYSDPREAMDRGIAMVHQELNLISDLSVAENVFLGRELVSALRLIRTQEQIECCREILAGLDNSIDPCTELRRLRVGQQQVVEIAKAVNNKVRVMFMDEPTSALSEQEVESLFALVRSLRDDGVAIVYVSHKLDELMQLCDRITVLRDGRLIDTLKTSDASQESIVRLMIGRELPDLYVRSPPPATRDKRLRVESLSLANATAPRLLVDNVSLHVDGGEVLGIFGLMGAGRTELLESIFGLHPRQSEGHIIVDGARAKIESPEQALRQGIGLVPEDRKHHGLIAGMSVEQNISLANLTDFEHALLLNGRREREHAMSSVEQLGIRTAGVQRNVETLSGGNQQKVVLSKILATRPKVLLMDEPTRGIDVNAKREIYTLINRLKQQGMAIVVASSELPELLGIADRIMVMCEGRKMLELARGDATEESLMQAAVPGATADHYA